MITPTDMLDEFNENEPLYREFAESIGRLAERLLADRKFAVHTVVTRVKTTESLRTKLLRLDAGYGNLADVTDLVGVRIITFFSDDVHRAADIVQSEFEIDRERSVDKGALLDPDRFGYLSLHFIASLSPERLRLKEYSRFANMRVEIQIRSLLQHAWAEIEHDLGYKTKNAPPPSIRRRFSRLAGLLEIADSEFQEIRRASISYRESVIKRIVETPEDVSTNTASLIQFVQSNGVVRSLDEDLAKFGNASLKLRTSFIETRVEELASLGLSTISAIEQALHSHRHEIRLLGKNFLEDGGLMEISRGISLLYLEYAVIGQGASEGRDLQEFLDRFEIGWPEQRAEFAGKLLTILRAASS